MTSTPSQPTVAYKRHVRNYLLDSHFQLKYAGFLVAVAIVISAVVGSVLFQTTRSVMRESAKAVEESRQAAEESRQVSLVSQMNVRELAADSPELAAEFSKQADAYDKVVAERDRGFVAERESLIQRQRRMIFALVGGLTLMVVLIGLLGIYITHKVAGPVYKMRQLLKQVGRGNLRVEGRLRRGDELKAIFDTFAEMVSGLRDFEARRLDDVEGALAALEQGDTKEATDRLDRVRASIRQSMG
ncbi:MAG TPA: hypothetical protein VGM06_04835 [Polyangiaceae bacterium]|jgi:nitrogen fixation/metabolism regulation signal transduction histidine kinase